MNFNIVDVFSVIFVIIVFLLFVMVIFFVVLILFYVVYKERKLCVFLVMLVMNLCVVGFFLGFIFGLFILIYDVI